MTHKLSTGIESLDRKLSGGIEPGSLFAISAEPAMQSEALFQPMMEKRPTLYLSALRSTEAVRESMGVTDQEVAFEGFGGKQSIDSEFPAQETGARTPTVSTDGGSNKLDAVSDMVQKISQQINVIIDPVNPLEETGDRGRYRELLNDVKSKLLETGSVGVLHCNRLNGVDSCDVTLAMSDIVLNLELVPGKNKLHYQVTIPKNRGGKPLLTQTTVVIDSDVWIDDSRRI